MIVVDTSALIEVLLLTDAGRQIENRLFGRGETLHAPHLIDLEIAQVLRRYCTAGDVDAAHGAEALSDLVDLLLSRYPHDLLLPRIWELRSVMSAYDAAYVALAELLSAPLITRDRKLAATRGHAARVQLV